MSPTPQREPAGTQFWMRPQDMTDVARNLSRDTSDFTAWSTKVRHRLAADPAAAWKSAGFFQVPTAVQNQRNGTNSASALLRIVEEDMRLLTQGTRKLVENFNDLDGLNGASVDQIAAVIGRAGRSGNAELLQ